MELFFSDHLSEPQRLYMSHMYCEFAVFPLSAETNCMEWRKVSLILSYSLQFRFLRKFVGANDLYRISSLAMKCLLLLSFFNCDLCSSDFLSFSLSCRLESLFLRVFSGFISPGSFIPLFPSVVDLPSKLIYLDLTTLLYVFIVSALVWILVLKGFL